MQILKKINPENNLKTRALLYGVGIGGILHLLSLLVVAIIKHNSSWFNPLFTIDAEKVFPNLQNNFVTFWAGWALFVTFLYLIFLVLLKSKKHD